MVDIIDPKWSELDASNNGAAPDGVQGNYAPNTIAPILRGTRGALKRFYVQNNAGYTSTGTASNYVLTYAGAPTAYSKGVFYSFWPNHTNTGAATLNINALGAKPIVRNDGAPLTASQITSGNVATVVYDGTNFRLQSPTTNPTFTGQVDVGSLVSAGSITGTAGNLSSLGVTGDITLAGTLKVSPTNGINFGNDDTITFNDATNTWTFAVDTTGGSLASQIATNVLTLTGTANLLRLDTPTGDTTSDPYMTFNKNGVRQGYIQHADGSGETFGMRIVNDVSGDSIVLGNSNNNSTLKFADASTGLVNTIWHEGNDGTGSGLDADKIDGYEAANLYRHNASFSTAGNLTITNGSPAIVLNDTDVTSVWRIMANSGSLYISEDNAGDGSYETPQPLQLARNNSFGQLWGSPIWTDANTDAAKINGFIGYTPVTPARLVTAGNGLSGGGNLGADRTITLGTPGTITNSTTNSVSATSHTHAISLSPADVGAPPTSRSINANLGLLGGGDLSADRNISLGTPSTITGSTTNAVTTNSHTHALTLVSGDITGALGYTPVTPIRLVTAGNGLTGGGNLGADRTITLGTPGSISGSSTNSVTSTSHTHELLLASADITNALGFTPADRGRQIVAGNGLSGGGALTADRTVTLGTPGSITNSTTNSVTTTSHTHALGFIAAEVFTGSSAATTAFPLGHMVYYYNTNEAVARNGLADPALRTGYTASYISASHSQGETALAGTWRSRGAQNDGFDDWTMAQRVA